MELKMPNIKANQIYLSENLAFMKTCEANSIDSCSSDFPYNLGFMGKNGIPFRIITAGVFKERQSCCEL